MHLMAYSDYGFMNAPTVVEKTRLFSMYTQDFQRPNADPYQLHAACQKGKLFEHISSVLSMGIKEE